MGGGLGHLSSLQAFGRGSLAIADFVCSNPLTYLNEILGNSLVSCDESGHTKSPYNHRVRR